MTQTQKELEQNIAWLKSHYYSLLKRVERLEQERLTVAVAPCACQFGSETKEATGETL